VCVEEPLLQAMRLEFQHNVNVSAPTILPTVPVPTHLALGHLIFSIQTVQDAAAFTWRVFQFLEGQPLIRPHGEDES
jgi:hypothetical protein